MPSGSNTTSNFNNRLVNTVYENKETLKECFENLQINRNQATVQAATGLLHMMNNEDFNFWLTFFHYIVPYVDVLYNQLQHHNTNSTSIYNAVNEFLEAIVTEINNIPSATHQEENPPPAKERKEVTQNLVSAKEVCNNITCQTKERFASTKHLSAEKLLNPYLFQENANVCYLPSART